MKKLYIPFKFNKDIIGGPNTFSKNIIDNLNKVNYPYQENSFMAKAIFFPIQTTLKNIAKVKFFGGSVIQRLDGCYYEDALVNETISYNDKNRSFERIYKEYADHVVFQSEYSKQQIFHILGEIDKSKYNIIYNGANTDYFYPSERTTLNDKIVFSVTGNFRHMIKIAPCLEALDELYKEGLDFEFRIIGNIDMPEKEMILSKKYVTNLTIKDQKQLGEELRTTDIFLFSSYNAPCPNSVIEATCCGLPVVGYDSGANGELLFFNKDLLAEMPDEVLHNFSEYDSTILLEKIRLAIKDFKKYKENAVKHSSYFNIDKCIQEYIKVFDDSSKFKQTYCESLKQALKAYKTYKAEKKAKRKAKKLSKKR